MALQRSLQSGLWLVAACLALANARADEPPAWLITVDPGDVDRSNLPVRVPLDVPLGLAEARIRIVLADGSQIDAQLVEPGLLAGRATPGVAAVRRDLLFVLPRLPAGAVVEVTAEPAPPSAEPKPARLAWTADS